jgi:hypothetical protein
VFNKIRGKRSYRYRTVDHPRHPNSAPLLLGLTTHFQPVSKLTRQYPNAECVRHSGRKLA